MKKFIELDVRCKQKRDLKKRIQKKEHNNDWQKRRMNDEMKTRDKVNKKRKVMKKANKSEK